LDIKSVNQKHDTRYELSSRNQNDNDVSSSVTIVSLPATYISDLSRSPYERQDNVYEFFRSNILIPHYLASPYTVIYISVSKIFIRYFLIVYIEYSKSPYELPRQSDPRG